MLPSYWRKLWLLRLEYLWVSEALKYLVCLMKNEAIVWGMLVLQKTYLASYFILQVLELTYTAGRFWLSWTVWKGAEEPVSWV